MFAGGGTLRKRVEGAGGGTPQAKARAMCTRGGGGGEGQGEARPKPGLGQCVPGVKLNKRGERVEGARVRLVRLVCWVHLVCLEPGAFVSCRTHLKHQKHQMHPTKTRNTKSTKE